METPFAIFWSSLIIGLGAWFSGYFMQKSNNQFRSRDVGSLSRNRIFVLFGVKHGNKFYFQAGCIQILSLFYLVGGTIAAIKNDVEFFNDLTSIFFISAFFTALFFVILNKLILRR